MTHYNRWIFITYTVVKTHLQVDLFDFRIRWGKMFTVSLNEMENEPGVHRCRDGQTYLLKTTSFKITVYLTLCGIMG